MAYVYLFDFGNALITFSVAHFLASRYGQSDQARRMISLKFMKSPPMICLVIAIILNLAGLQIPTFGIKTLRIFSDLLTPLVMLSLGIYFNPRIVKAGPLATVLGIQFVGGLIIGYLIVYFFGLEGIGRAVVQILAICPIAMNTLAYASMENLDKEFAASAVSCSTIISMILIPTMIYFLHS